MTKRLLVILSFALSISAFADEFISVPAPSGGFFTPSTNALFWENQNTKGTVVHLPGGTGQFNVTSLWPRERVHSFGSILTLLLDRKVTSGNVSSAYIDSPYSLGGYDLSARYSSDHLNRVASVIRIIYAKTNKPIWLFGHSNGAVSAIEMYNHLSLTNEQYMLGGIILSSSRNEIRTPNSINVPVLFIHNNNDGCKNTLYATAQQRYSEIKAINKSRTEFATVSTANTSDKPCFAGAHMYENNYAEIAQIIDRFINQ